MSRVRRNSHYSLSKLGRRASSWWNGVPLEAKPEESRISRTYERSFRRHSDRPRQKSHRGRFAPISRRRFMEQTEAWIWVFAANGDCWSQLWRVFARKMRNKIYSVALFLPQLVWKETLSERNENWIKPSGKGKLVFAARLLMHSNLLLFFALPTFFFSFSGKLHI